MGSVELVAYWKERIASLTKQRDELTRKLGTGTVSDIVVEHSVDFLTNEIANANEDLKRAEAEAWLP